MYTRIHNIYKHTYIYIYEYPRTDTKGLGTLTYHEFRVALRELGRSQVPTQKSPISLQKDPYLFKGALYLSKRALIPAKVPHISPKELWELGRTEKRVKKTDISSKEPHIAPKYTISPQESNTSSPELGRTPKKKKSNYFEPNLYESNV